MKKIALILLFTGLQFISDSQNVNLVWAKQMGGNSFGSSIITDAFSNVYTTGNFSDTTDFDPGPGVFNLVALGSYDAYISKLDSAGNFVWGKQIKCINDTSWATCTAITLDVLGNIYIIGHFVGTIDSDPSAGVFNLSSINTNGISEIFVSKLDTAGNFVWAKQFGGSGALGLLSSSITVDVLGNILTTGLFSGITDFDPGPGIFNLSNISAAFQDIFISKLDADGNFIFAKQVGGGFSNSFGRSITSDGSENIYITGFFSTFGGTHLDFDPGPGTYYLSSDSGGDIFILKLNAAGNFVWVKPMSGTGTDVGFSITVDASGNSYTTGYLFLPNSNSDIFILKLDPSGNSVWTKQMGGSGFEESHSIAIDSSGNIYTTGFFSGTADFDPGVGIFNLVSVGGQDIFVSKLDVSGNFVWAKQLGGTGSEGGRSVKVDASGNVYTTGYFSGTVDFDPSLNTLNLSATGNGDAFVHKMSKCTNTTFFSFTASSCNTYILNGQAYNSSGLYTQTLVNTAGCDSILTLNLTISLNSNHVTNAVACNSYIWNGTTYTTSGVYFDTLIAANGCDSIVTLHLIVNLSITTNDTIAACNHYVWNGITYTTSGVYSDTLVAANGCDSIVTLHLTIINNTDAIVAHPVNMEICSSSNVSFSVSAISNQTMSYEWQVSIDGGITYSSVVNSVIYTGATTSVLTIIATNASFNNNRYRCKLSNNLCNSSIISNSAILTIRKLPTIGLTASPITSLFPWQSTTLSATPVSSGGVLSATWLYNNAIVSNIGSTRPVNFDQLGTYQVRIQERWPSDLVCFNQSDIVTITARAGKELIIYPNPNNGQFKISYYNSDGVSDLKVVTVYDAKGAKVHNARFTITGVYASLGINIIPAAAGFYSVVISDDNGQRLAVGKMIVMH